MQAAAQAAESDRLLARSLAERAELQARYMALGAKLGAIVRGNAATTCRLQQARPPIYAAREESMAICGSNLAHGILT